MEAVRNYVQHRAAPLYSVSYDHRSVEFSDGIKLRFSTKALMRIGDLAQDPKFKKTVLDELREMGNEVDLPFFVRDYVAGLSVVHQKLRDILEPNIANWDIVICNAMDRFRIAFPDEAARGTMFAMSRDEEVWLSREFIEARRSLEQKNISAANLPRRYVTSENPMWSKQ